ncbi:MAG: hypothetical protein QXK88_06590 [Desulfurococcaceae archaeon]
MSKLVKKHLKQYDKVILNSSATIMDDWLRCNLCTYVVGFICTHTTLVLASWIVAYLICVSLCSAITGGFFAWLCGVICGPIASAVLAFMIAVGIFIACMYFGLLICQLLKFCP